MDPAQRRAARAGLKALLLALAAASLAACGPSQPSGSAPDKQIVVLGHAGPLTGSIAHQGKDDENGVALALDEANARNLVIGGRRITFRML